MDAYHDLVHNVLADGTYRPNRTAKDSVSTFGSHYTVDLSEGYPLLTTKDMSGYRWQSMIHEFLWYLTGEHHIRNLKEETKIWNVWADDDWNLPTAYGRFWRRFPIPDADNWLDGEWWAEEDASWYDDAVERFDTTEEMLNSTMNRWVHEDPDGGRVFDQLQYVIDTLNEKNPMRGPETRRLIVSAWHPANAAVSHLPPCHYTFVFNVQGDGTLNLHLTQRSGDVALGIPFNIAAYSLLTNAIAQQTGYEIGEFSHTIVDAHIYCGEDQRGQWYGNNLDELQRRLQSVDSRDDYAAIRDWISETAPQEIEDGNDHIPRLLTQLTREPRERPTLAIADKPLDELTYEDIAVEDYDPADALSFNIAE